MLTDGKHLFVEAAGLKDVINASRHGQLAMRDLIALMNNFDFSCGDSMTRDGGWTELEN